MFDSIRKQGMNRNKYKEKQEENIKNPTENSWINKNRIEPLKSKWVIFPHFGLNRICETPNRI